MKVLLWDVDGTLLLNGGRAGLLYDDAIARLTGTDPPGASPGEHGKTDAQILTERLAAGGHDPALFPRALALLDELSLEGNSGPYARRIAPGVEAALDATGAAGWTHGLLTGNSPTRVRHKFAGAGLDAARFDWDLGFFGDRALVRQDIALEAKDRLGDVPAVIVGDTPSDGVAADAGGFPFVAVATGVFTEEDLRVTDAAVVVPDLAVGLDAVLAYLETVA